LDNWIPAIQQFFQAILNASITSNFGIKAEALVHKYVPLEAILGIACVNDVISNDLETRLEQHGIELTVRSTPTWYF
jgi:hypothetical protein